MKIGILGGTFDPIHLGHIRLGIESYTFAGLDEIWYLPNGNPPHKSVSIDNEIVGHRMNMIKLAIEEYSYMKLCDYEIKSSDTKCYSYKTMKALSDLYHEHRFYFIIGGDSLLSLESWAYPDILLQCASLLVAPRSPHQIDELRKTAYILEEKYKCEILLMDIPVTEISSSELRKQELSSNQFLDTQVLEYINQHKLY